MRILELFCGIGGVACVVDVLASRGGGGRVVGAVDTSEAAGRVYAAWHGSPPLRAAVETLTDDRWATLDADLWWLSPPCQPFTTRGTRRDLDDPRCDGLRAVLARLDHLSSRSSARGETPRRRGSGASPVLPRALALENVPGFRDSRAHRELRRVLEAAGFSTVVELEACPSELGWPNRRRRFYVLAVREGPLLPEPPRPAWESVPALSDLLDQQPDADLAIDSGLADRYRRALHRVPLDSTGDASVTACFTAAYGRSIVRSGSYLEDPDGVLRRASPDEVLRLLGFPKRYRFPDGVSRRLAWRLAGNGLSLPVVARLLSRFPGLAPPGATPETLLPHSITTSELPCPQRLSRSSAPSTSAARSIPTAERRSRSRSSTTRAIS